MTNTAYDGSGDSLDELFDVLSHGHRRHILRGLADPNRQTGAGIGTITRMEDGESDVIELKLRHDHLPKLDECGLVDWDPEAGTLARGPRFGDVEPFLEALEADREALP
jgi:hypothetical protein